MSSKRIRTKRVYQAPEPDDGSRILIDRLWARGLSRDKASIDTWMKEIAPSTELRQWYGHDPKKWIKFKTRYFAELEDKTELVEELLEFVRAGTVTLVFSSKETKLNNAAALKEYIERHL